MRGDHRSLLTLLNIPEHHEQHGCNNDFDSDQRPIGGAQLLNLVDGQICGQECGGKGNHANPIHLRSLGSGGFFRIHEHKHNGKHRNANHDPEHGTETERASKPAAKNSVDTADATINGSQNSHELGVLLIFSNLGVQHDQRHRHNRTGNTLNHTTDHQHRHVDRERGNHAAQSGKHKNAKQHFLATDQIAESRQEQREHCARGEEHRLGQANLRIGGVEFNTHGRQCRRKHGRVELEREDGCHQCCHQCDDGLAAFVEHFAVFGLCH